MRRNGTLPRVGTSLALIAAATGLAACGGASSKTAARAAPESAYLAAVTRAADVTDRVPGYKLALTATTTINGSSTTLSGSASLDDRGSEGEMTIQVAGKRIEEVFDKPFIYIKLPSGTPASATHGKPWGRIDFSAVGSSFGDSTLGEGSSDPAQELGYLKSAGTVTRVGSEAVRGAPVTHYHALIELDRLAAAVPAAQRAGERKAAAMLERITGSRTLPMDVWVGADGRVARLSFTESICSPEGKIQESENLELFDYGRQPVVAPPPQAQVSDISSTVESNLAKSLASLSCG